MIDYTPKKIDGYVNGLFSLKIVMHAAAPKRDAPAADQ